MASEGALVDSLRPPRPARKCGGGSCGADLLAGLLAGTVSRTLTAPIERVKVELQLAQTRESARAVASRVVAQGGARGLFQGNLVNCLKVAPQSAFFFALTDYFKGVLPTRGDPAAAQAHSFLSGTLAGVGSQLLVYPLEPIKTCITAAPPGRYEGMLDCGRQMVRRGGVGALFRGTLPTLAGCVPYAGIQRMAYDELQSQHARHGGRATATADLACGLLSSTVAMSASYPLVLVRTRLHVQVAAPELTATYSGVSDCFRKTLATEGVRGLFKGLLPNLAKGAPAAAVNFAVYEEAKRLVEQYV